MSTVAIIAHQAFSLHNFRGHLIREIVGQGHRVIALAPDYTPSSRQAVIDLGAQTMDYPLARAGLNPLQDLRSLAALTRRLSDIAPDITLCYAIKPSIYGTLAASWAGVPHRVALIEGLGFTFTDSGRTSAARRLLRGMVVRMYRSALKRAHRVLFLNRDDIAEFVRRDLVSPESALCLGGIGVSLDEWQPSRPPGAPMSFVMVARLLREKGVLEYVEAARRVKAHHPATRFLLLGDLDPNPGAIALAQMQAWVAEGVIEWPGQVDVKPWLQQANVFVLPSYREGVPRSTQEAMATGRAVITTDVPGCRETVVEGVNGFLVEPRNVEALASAMLRFVEDPQLCRRMGAESRRLAEERFDVHKVNQRLLTILKLARVRSEAVQAP